MIMLLIHVWTGSAGDGLFGGMELKAEDQEEDSEQASASGFGFLAEQSEEPAQHASSFDFLAELSAPAPAVEDDDTAPTSGFGFLVSQSNTEESAEASTASVDQESHSSFSFLSVPKYPVFIIVYCELLLDRAKTSILLITMLTL